jgi:hypothetical protein
MFVLFKSIFYFYNAEKGGNFIEPDGLIGFCKLLQLFPLALPKFNNCSFEEELIGADIPPPNDNDACSYE